MSKPPARAAMDSALASVVVTWLRSQGFTGSMPHFRRRRPDQTDLLTFQHWHASGRFCVEAGRCGPDGFTTHWGQHVPSAKVTAHDIGFVVSGDETAASGEARVRLSPRGHGDHWFVYGPQDFEDGFGVMEHLEHYERIAFDTLRLIETQGERFWHGLASMDFS